MGTSRNVSRGPGRFRKHFVDRPSNPSKFRDVEAMVRGPLGEQVYLFRREFGFTRAVLAVKMRVNESTIHGWEFGEHEPSNLQWESFCRVRRAYLKKKRLAPVTPGNI